MNKLHQRKRWILLLSLVVLSLSFCLSSFALQPPTPISSSALALNPTEADCDLLLSIINMQAYCGSFNSLQPVALYRTSSNYLVLVLAMAGDLAYTVTQDSSTLKWRIAINNYGMLQVYLNEQGFSINRVWNYTLIDDDDLIFYSSAYGYSLAYNDGFVPADGVDTTDSLVSVYESWGEYYLKLVNYDSDLQDRYDSGYEEGESIGYQDGYDLGYFEGESEGKEIGFSDGFAYGAEEGFNEGYDAGYDDGLEDATCEAEVVTEIIYREPVDIDFGSIFDGVSSVPQNTIGTVFDFTIGDINVAGLLRLLIIVFVISAVIVFIVKKL